MSKKQQARVWRLWNLRYTKRVLAASPESQMAVALFSCWSDYPNVQSALRQRFRLTY